MPYQNPELDSMDQLSELPDDSGGAPGGPPMPGGPPTGPSAGPPTGPPVGPPPSQLQPAVSGAGGLGGPGIDTPGEKKAMVALSRGVMAIREATKFDPSLRPIVDKMLQDGFLQIMRHYGMEQEGKLSLQQAKMKADRMRSAPLRGGSMPQRPTVM